jgi:hypothetical protein
VIAQGTQQIVSMDVKTGRPASPPDGLMDQFRFENPRVFPFERFPKIAAVKIRLLHSDKWNDGLGCV